jgi:hypothetical protein
MLRAAGAPEPWSAPDQCVPIEAFPLPKRRQRSPEERAQEAVAELRRVLSAVIARATTRLDHARLVLAAGDHRSASFDQIVPKTTAALASQSARLQALHHLMSAVEQAPRLSWRPPTDWHLAAWPLGAYYHLVVGDGGTSADGPAVRFVEAALDRLGWPARSPAAVSKAIKGTDREKSFMGNFSRYAKEP